MIKRVLTLVSSAMLFFGPIAAAKIPHNADALKISPTERVPRVVEKGGWDFFTSFLKYVAAGGAAGAGLGLSYSFGAQEGIERARVGYLPNPAHADVPNDVKQQVLTKEKGDALQGAAILTGFVGGMILGGGFFLIKTPVEWLMEKVFPEPSPDCPYPR